MQREVFYISGYDPRGYRFYYTLLKKNLAIYDGACEISALQSFNKSHASCEIKAEQTRCVYHFLSWSEVVKKYWLKGVFAALKDCFYFFKTYVLTGVFLEYGKSCPATLIAGFFPFFYFILSFLFVFLLALGIFSLGIWGVNALLSSVLSPNLSLVLGVLAGGFLAFVFLYFAFKFIDKFAAKSAAFWLLRICTFCERLAKGEIKELESKESEFFELIFKSLEQNAHKKDYELIISAHSVGTIVLLGVVSRLVQSARKANLSLKNVKILTLGECIPLASYHKKALRVNEELDYLSNCKDLTWFDFTSKIDGASFFRLDFFTSSRKLRGLEGVSEKDKINASFLSANFFRLYDEQTYKSFRKDWYKVHFLYLCANEIKGGEYDYFAFLTQNDVLENYIRKV